MGLLLHIDKKSLLFGLLITLFISKLQAQSMEGCYVSKDSIVNEATEKVKEQISYIKIVKKHNQFFASGLIFGGNFHVCSILSPMEGSEDPLPLTLMSNSLNYDELDSYNKIDCHLKLSIVNDELTISDENYHCSNYIFSCGARVGLDGIKLLKSSNSCSNVSKTDIN